MSRRHGPVRVVSAATRYAILTVVSAILLAPFIFCISISLASQQTSVQMTFTLFPHEFNFSNYLLAFTGKYPMGTWILNSVILVVIACIGMTLSSALVAYGFARLRARGKNILFILLLSTMMIPGEVLLIPQFILFRTMGWINTLAPIVVPQLFANAYNVFLMRQFIARIPRELDEAAQLDGLGQFGIFTRIMLPLMKPVLTAIVVFTFTANWGYFFGPLIYINDQNRMPLALGIQIMSAGQGGSMVPPWNLVMVGAIILIIPMIIVYHFGQRYLYEAGLVSGSAGIK